MENKNINQELTLKEQKLQEIQLKRAEKKKLTPEDKIFLKRLEIDELMKIAAQKDKKKKEAWLRGILGTIKADILNFYTEENNDIDLKISSVILSSLENLESQLKNIDLKKYVVKNEKTGKITRIRNEVEG